MSVKGWQASWKFEITFKYVMPMSMVARREQTGGGEGLSRLMMILSCSQMSVLEGISSSLCICQLKVSKSGSQHLPAYGGTAWAWVPGASVCLLSGSLINICSIHGTPAFIKPIYQEHFLSQQKILYWTVNVKIYHLVLSPLSLWDSIDPLICMEHWYVCLFLLLYSFCSAVYLFSLQESDSAIASPSLVAFFSLP